MVLFTPDMIFQKYCAKVFEVSSEIEEDDVLKRNFMDQLQTGLLQVVDLQNDRNLSRGEPVLNTAEVPYLVTCWDDAIPFDADICLYVIPLYLASEYYRDSGNYDLSAYFHDQFITAVNERMVYNATGCDSVL